MPAGLHLACEWLSFLFQVLSLPEQALVYADSTYQFLEPEAKVNSWVNNFKTGVMQTRQQLFFDLLERTGKRQYADSIYKIHKEIMSQKTEEAGLQC